MGRDADFPAEQRVGEPNFIRIRGQVDHRQPGIDKDVSHQVLIKYGDLLDPPFNLFVPL